MSESENDTDRRYPDLPYALVKAMEDPFDYALGLRNGVIIEFSLARMDETGHWMYLSVDDRPYEHPPMTGTSMPFERGLYVRVADIVWVAQAPRGS